MAGFSDGFDLGGFGPLLSDIAPILYYIGYLHRKKKEPSMNSLIFNSTTPTGYLDPGEKNQGFLIKHIEMDVPLDEVGTTDPTITLSGQWTGSYTFHADTSPELRFKNNEPISVSTDLPTAEYSAVLKYVRYNSDDAYTQEGVRAGMNFIPKSTWESSKVEPTGIL